MDDDDTVEDDPEDENLEQSLIGRKIASKRANIAEQLKVGCTYSFAYCP